MGDKEVTEEEKEFIDPDSSDDYKNKIRCRNLSDDELCSYWANDGDCDLNPSFMLYNCQKSCKVCIDQEEKLLSSEDDCSAQNSFEGECKRGDNDMKDILDVGYIQHFGNVTNIEDEISILQVIRRSHLYLINNVIKQWKFARKKSLCRNNHE